MVDQPTDIAIPRHVFLKEKRVEKIIILVFVLKLRCGTGGLNIIRNYLGFFLVMVFPKNCCSGRSQCKQAKTLKPTHTHCCYVVT